VRVVCRVCRVCRVFRVGQVIRVGTSLLARSTRRDEKAPRPLLRGRGTSSNPDARD
jgi:hypothetical protein